MILSYTTKEYMTLMIRGMSLDLQLVKSEYTIKHHPINKIAKMIKILKTIIL